MKKVNRYIIDGKSVPGVTTIIGWRMSKGLCIGFFGKNTPEEAKKIGDAGKEFGEMVHKLVAGHIGKQKQTLNEVQQTILDNFKLVTEGWEWLETEKIVLNKAHMYGGTADAIAIVNGKKTLVDIKTGGLYDGQEAVQLSAYKECLPEVEQCIVLHLDKETNAWEVLNRETEGIFKVFRAFKTIYDYETGKTQ